MSNSNGEEICTTRKRGYASQRTAREAINFIKKGRSRNKNNNKSIPQREYLCEECGQWHLTSRPDFKKKKYK